MRDENKDTITYEYVDNVLKETFRDSNFTRESKARGYNLYKIARLCQSGINKILLRKDESGVQTFG
ncbi:15291_t:CDS:2, partial [Racocetra fulgida]